MIFWNIPLYSLWSAPLKFEDVDISTLTGNVIGQFEPICEREGYSIEALIEPEQLVKGESKQLARVLYNLIDNAVNHSGDGGRIQVVLKNLGASVRIEVRDYGEGIPNDELPDIWDRYFMSKQRKHKGGGTGLGLSIAKEILLMHKAKFGVESEPGQGSMFWFELEKQHLQLDGALPPI